jgi:hypothetical protein
LAALVETSEPNRSSDSVKCRLAFFCMVGRSIDAQLAHGVDVVGILDAGGLHGGAGGLDGAADARLAHEHVVRLLRSA